MSAGDRKTACVTGGNGYIAAALVKMLLEKGYAIKTTVRNPDDMEKNSHLKELQALGPLEVLRADLNEEGSFDQAVAGCDYAFLVAAPVNLTSENPEKDQIEPSIRGTLNVMRSCAKAGTVRRVILTSAASSVCIRPLEGDGHVLDEESWSDLKYVTTEKPPSWGYVVSKVLSEKEACRFAQEHGISLVTVCPVLTVGASPVSKVYASVPASLAMLSGDNAALGMLKGIEKSFGAVPMVDLDDLCRAEVFVAETETASGRYICCSFSTTVVVIARFLADKYPQYSVKTNLLSGELLEKPRMCLSSAKLVGEGFEFKYNTLDEIYEDVIEYGKALGILPY
ncbi:anthocyanidin reductase ((2S)-flavan-3-ol-forming)-like [Phragmites australis]|uniref:anthocyanidin reductase ((2S)-flavan-3-ol-forming)-like n=1 Tax=Phragmites australis TaxID=29695 RepID=UPI002D76BF45|nr:anthocyanidin reductase ((2S)-flavan-3-ol-forming)-like [Phragmites australis]